MSKLFFGGYYNADELGTESQIHFEHTGSKWSLKFLNMNAGESVWKLD